MHIIRKIKEVDLVIYVAILLSIMTFGLTYGFNILNPTYDDWLLVGGDLSQHYIGWEAFRNSPWKFPFVFNELTYPTYISIMFTDSIPILAIFFKLLSPILPSTFQYWGLFGLCSYILMGIMSSIIIKKYSQSPIYTLIGTEFFLICPIVLIRLYGHDALGGGQWIILLALMGIVYYKEKFSDLKNGLVLWAIISVLSCYIHLYFALFCLIILFGYCLYDYLNTKRIRRTLAYLLDYFLVLLVSIFSLGGFTGGDKSAGGYGHYSSNLNTFFNPVGRSVILKDLPTWGSGQYEGYAYLGFGIIVLLFIVLILVIFNRVNITIYNPKKAICLTLIAVFSFAYALSYNIALGDKLLISLPISEKLIKFLGIFRCSGRVSWVCVYLIYLYLICALGLGFRQISSNKRRNILILILGTCLVIQIFDLSGSLKGKYEQYINIKVYINDISQSNSMQEIGDDSDIEHINIVRELSTMDLYYPIAQYAVANNKTVNRFVTVHSTGRDDENKKAINDLENVTDDTAYLFSDIEKSLCIKYSLKAYDAGEYTVAVSDGLTDTKKVPYRELDDVTDWFNSEDGFGIRDGEDNKEIKIRYIYPGGVSYGPYKYVVGGTYHVEIQGDNLASCVFSCSSDKGSYNWEINNLEVSDTMAEYDVSFNKEIYDIEFVITNRGTENVKLSKISYGLK